MKIQAKDMIEGYFLPGIDNGYVVEVETDTAGYLSYPSTSSASSVAMPEDTVLITFHDRDGEDCYLLMPAESLIEVTEDA
jgi:hypothetical protein